jgi:streptogramin lyase
MKRIAVVALALLAACSSPSSPGSSPVPDAAQQPAAMRPAKMTLTGYYSVPSFGSVDIDGLTNGPGRSIWYTEFEGSAIGKMTTAGVTTSSFTTPDEAQLEGIAASHSRKRIWSGGYGGTMVMLTAAGAQLDFTIAGAHIGAVILGPDKNIWFADYGNFKIGTITANGVVTEFALPAGSIPADMAAGSDGNFWVTDVGRDKIVKVSPSGVALASYGSAKLVNPVNIVAAPDGDLYFSQAASNTTIDDKIARITTKGKITEIGTLPPNAYPNHLTIGKDKNVYFSIAHLQAVGKIDLANAKVTYQYLPLTSDIGTDAIVTGPDGRLYLAGGYTIYAVTL